MKPSRRMLAATLLGTFLAAVRPRAHHSFAAEDDDNKPVALTGCRGEVGAMGRSRLRLVVQDDIEQRTMNF